MTSSACSGGTIPAGIHSVEVEESAGGVVIDVRVEVPDGTWPTTCPPNPILSAVAPLDSALGDRSIKAVTRNGLDHLWPVTDQRIDGLFSTTTIAGPFTIGSSPDNPAPIGTVASIGGWNVIVMGLVIPADEGEPALVEVAVAYVREVGTGSFFEDVVVTAVDRGAREYLPAQDGCPLALEQPEPGMQLPGVNLQGNLCFRISGGVAGLQLKLAPGDETSGDSVYFSTN